MIALELKLKFAVDPGKSGYDYTSPATAGSELLEALEDCKFLDRLNLLPKDTAVRRQAGRLRPWPWARARMSDDRDGMPNCPGGGLVSAGKPP